MYTEKDREVNLQAQRKLCSEILDVQHKIDKITKKVQEQRKELNTLRSEYTLIFQELKH